MVKWRGCMKVIIHSDGVSGGGEAFIRAVRVVHNNGVSMWGSLLGSLEQCLIME